MIQKTDCGLIVAIVNPTSHLQPSPEHGSGDDVSGAFFKNFDRSQRTVGKDEITPRQTSRTFFTGQPKFTSDDVESASTSFIAPSENVAPVRRPSIARRRECSSSAISGKCFRLFLVWFSDNRNLVEHHLANAVLAPCPPRRSTRIGKSLYPDKAACHDGKNRFRRCQSLTAYLRVSRRL